MTLQGTTTMRALTRIKHRLFDEHGISMVAAMGAMVVGMLLSAAAFATANSGIEFNRNDRWSKLAYQRAQSGMADYVKRLANDPQAWTACDRNGLGTGDGFGQSAINDTIYGSAYDTAYGVVGGHPSRRWLPYKQPGTADDLNLTSQYTIDLLPANGTVCGTTNATTAADRMINSLTGTFRVRITGRAGPPAPPATIDGAAAPANGYSAAVEAYRKSHWKSVSIVSEFRRAGFLDYAYFTDHEAMDRNLISGDQSFIGWIVSWFNNPGDLGVRCDDYYRRAVDGATVGREAVENSGWTCPNDRPIYKGEQIKGPFHTNDSVLVESTSTVDGPIFGQQPGDRIEIYDRGQSKAKVCANSNADRSGGNCECPFRTAKKFFNTNLPTNRTCSKTARTASGVQLVTGPDAGFIQMPAGNSELKTWAGAAATSSGGGSLYTGKTIITLNNNGTYTVTNSVASPAITNVTKPIPADGVIYVQNKTGVGTCESQPEFLNYTDSTLPGGMKDGCALVEVKAVAAGYNKSVTIGSESDIVITGDLAAADDSTLLGLVANNYVRVRHYAAASGDKDNYLKKCTYTFNLFDLTFPFFGFGDLANCIGISGFGDAISFIGDALQAASGKPIYTCARESGSVTGTPVGRIDAAILALKRSFTVDGSQCGAQITTSSPDTPTTGLNVFGAITQNWRGALTTQDWSAIFDGTCDYSGSNIFTQFAQAFLNVLQWCGNHHGYTTKDISYNYRLRALSPPHFLTPVESAWLVNRVRQSVPACNCGPTG
jgi:hypothetical protein